MLVVADPYSSFAPLGSACRRLAVRPASAIQVERGDCDIAALSGLYLLAGPGGATRFTAPAGSRPLLRSTARALRGRHPGRAGHVVAVGGADVFTNDALDQVDNAGLAIALMAARSGTQVVGAVGHAGQRVSRRGARRASASLDLDGGEAGPRRAGGGVRPLRLVAGPPAGPAGGRAPAGADRRLRAGARPRQPAGADPRSRPGGPPVARRPAPSSGRATRPAARTPRPHVVAEVTAARTPVDRDRVERAVTDTPIRSEDELLDLARDIDAIRTEVLHGSAP